MDRQRRQIGAHFLHRLDFDLANPFCGNRELACEIVQGCRVFFRQPTRFDDPAAAWVETAQGILEAVAVQSLAGAAFENMYRFAGVVGQIRRGNKSLVIVSLRVKAP
jgi:hypothetical protein